jgi:hypothetical protein
MGRSTSIARGNSGTSKILKIERFEILDRYQALNAEELNQKITEGNAPEHPGWEDLIEVKNIEQEIDEIENDIGAL